MSNGLAECGWVDYWEPNVALGSLKGMINGIDFPTDPKVSVVPQIAYPSGFQLQVDTPDAGLELRTPADPLLSEFGNTDFLVMVWGKVPLPAPVPLYVEGAFVCGENTNQGFDGGSLNSPYPATDALVYFEIPCVDNSYPFLTSGGERPYIYGTENVVICWWTVDDLTMHVQANNGTEFTLVSPVGTGPADPTQTFRQLLSGTTPGQTVGDMAICKDPIPDAAQRALLFGGLPFSQWDDGSAGNTSSSTGGRSGIVITPDQRLPQGITVTTRDLRRATPIRSYGRGRR